MSNVPLFVWPVGPIINTEPIRYVVNKTDHDLVVEALREQNRVLTEALEAAKYELAALFPIPSAPTVQAALEVCGNTNEADAKCIYLAYEAVCAALTATSRPTAAEVHQRMFDHGDATSQEGQHEAAN